MSEERIISSPVPESSAGMRLDLYLSGRFTYFARAGWQKEIRAGKVLINSQPCLIPHRSVNAGDLVAYQGAERQEPEVCRNYSILYRDEALIAVNKPWNLPVHPAGPFFSNTLLRILEADLNCRLFPVHRIDRETSGLVLFSLKQEVTAGLQAALAAGTKTYLVIVKGHPSSDAFSVNMPLGPDLRSPVRKKRAAYPGAPKMAVSHFTRITDRGPWSLLKAEIETGRIHQIRAHCLYSGLPVAGDKIYGGDERCYLEFIEQGMTPELEKSLGFHRSALHCLRIRITHPVTGEDLCITAPPADDLAELIPEIKELEI